MEPEPSANQPSTFPPSLFPLPSGDMPSLPNLSMLAGLPSIDQMPVEQTWCQVCETKAPRVHILMFSAVICPECRKVYVDGK